MRNLFLTLLLPIVLTVTSKTFAQVSSLSENFDATCATSSLPTSHSWQVFNTVTGSTTATPGNWACTSVNGRGSTPGMQCSGVYSSSYHLDTSYLVTPLVYFYGVSGNLYLNFDVKADSVTRGGELRVYASIDTSATSSSLSVDITAGVTPPLGAIDSSEWVTHQVNITRFEDTTHPFYISFRYTSSTSTGSIWFLDNVNTTPLRLNVPAPEAKIETLQVKVVGNSTSSQFTICYKVPAPGPYRVFVYDMMGREVHKEIINVQTGKLFHTVEGLNLSPGMYVLKMEGDGIGYGVSKFVVN